MSKPSRGLGRGLAGLIQDNSTITNKPEEVINTGDVANVDINLIEPNPTQPRTDFDEEKLQELSDSIKTLGIIQPITLRKTGDKYQIISGERRYRASKMAGLDKIPAYITDVDDSTMLQMALVENIQREDLNPIEVAFTYNRLIDECKLTQEDLSTRLGKGRSTITNSLRLLKLPDEMQAALKNKVVTVGQIRPLISLEDAEQQKNLFEKVLEYNLSARQVEELVKDPEGYIIRFADKPTEEGNAEENTDDKKVMVKAVRPKLTDEQKKLKKSFTKKFAVKVDLKVDSKGTSKIIFNLKTPEDYNKIVDLLNKVEI